MGVINLTPNSFYSQSIKQTDDDIVDTARKMEREGADIIDLGARSTAPYRKSEVPPKVEAKLLAHAVRLLVDKVKLPISADTTRLMAAEAAVSEGALILNDAYGLTQPDRVGLAKLVASEGLSVIITAHEQRQRATGDPVQRVRTAIQKSLDLATSLGIEESKITIDPGIGFFSDDLISNEEWNCTILNRLAELREFKRPVCVGVSRKKFIGTLTGGKDAKDRLVGSIAATAIAVYNGAHVIRTHDVAETLDAVRIAGAIKEKSLSQQRIFRLKQ